MIKQQKHPLFFIMTSFLCSITMHAAHMPANLNNATGDLALYAVCGETLQSKTPMLDFMVARCKNPFGTGATVDNIVAYDVQALKSAFLHAIRATNFEEATRVMKQTLACAKNTDLAWLFEKKGELLYGDARLSKQQREDILNNHAYFTRTLDSLRNEYWSGLQFRSLLLREMGLLTSTQTVISAQENYKPMQLTSEQERHLPMILVGRFYENELFLAEAHFVITVRELGIQNIDELIRQSTSKSQPIVAQASLPLPIHEQIAKEYSYADKNPIVLSGDTAQHEIYQEAYKLLHDAHLLRDEAQKIPGASFYVESSEELSLAAIEVAQAGDIAMASDCTDLASMLLQHAAYVVEKSALVAAGMAKGSAKGLISVAAAPLDYVYLGYKMCSIMGSSVKDAFSNLVTNPRQALEGYVESLQSIGRFTFDSDSAERKALQEKVTTFFAKVGEGFHDFIDLPLEDQVEFITEFAVPFLVTPQQLATKISAVDKVRKTVAKVVRNEAEALRACAQISRTSLVEFRGMRVSSAVVKEIAKVEGTLGKQLYGKELVSRVREIEKRIIADNAPLLTGAVQAACQREKILPKMVTYEQARNKALELIGEVDPHTSRPHIGELGIGEGKITGRRWHGKKVIMRLDYDLIKGPHINVDDWRLGKGIHGNKYAIPFEGDASTVESLLKHLN